MYVEAKSCLVGASVTVGQARKPARALELDLARAPGALGRWALSQARVTLAIFEALASTRAEQPLPAVPHGSSWGDGHPSLGG